jgi:hypothetical protein
MNRFSNMYGQAPLKDVTVSLEMLAMKDAAWKNLKIVEHNVMD